ncbi:hypothetical protein Pint_18205 [Pistacia integerrima]|uniref:Uncharacterized protein n=2 Tax=Pistacia integerrima TaxID=434235 RepID=A0ACC0YVQ3_9ROSI|nr:hypothetical protein Pint_18209 [Pistacia integerrima]KAJ0041844.1 hypothetical protein Pint_18205 [Pistacia integerrima]
MPSLDILRLLTLSLSSLLIGCENPRHFGKYGSIYGIEEDIYVGFLLINFFE